ncbi:MAG: NPCBM/NEW2 domain-containing protein [Planctomycetota bacterium]
MLDKVDGVLMGFSDQGVLFDTSLGDRVFAWGEVVHLYIEPLEEPQPVDGTEALVDLHGGGMLRGVLRSIDATGIELGSGFGTWKVPYAWIREMALLDGSFRYLTWLTPEASEAPRSPFDAPDSPPLGMVWPMRVDRSVTGDLLRAGGRVWSHGLGVHAPSRLRWKLDGGDCWLRLTAGLEDSAVRGDQAGTVRFSVWVDGKEVWDSGLRRGGEATLTLTRSHSRMRRCSSWW